MEDFIKTATTQQLHEDLWQTWTMGKVPTFVSKCPECDTFNVWSTTGLIMPIKCKNCKGEFKIDSLKIL
jgi:hypothetical protein